MSKNSVHSYLKKFMDLLFVGLVIFALTSCATSGGGSTPSATPAPQTASQTTPTDRRIAFATWTDTYTPNNAKTPQFTVAARATYPNNNKPSKADSILGLA